MNLRTIVKKAGPYAYMVPAMAVFAVFLFFPFFKTIYLSLYKTNKMGQAKLFVGLLNYKDLLNSPSFFQQPSGNRSICHNCRVSEHAFRARCRSSLQQNLSRDPDLQHCLRTPNGHCFQFRCHDI